MKAIIILFTLTMASVLTAAPQHGQGPEGFGPPPPPDPAEMAIELVAAFDTDNSGGLDAEELAEALVFLHENRPKPPRSRGPRDE